MPVTGGGFYFPQAGSLDCVSLHISPGIDGSDKQGLWNRTKAKLEKYACMLLSE